MGILSEIYNYQAERRFQELDFVGKDRRSLILNAQHQKALEENNEKFLKGIEDIKNIKQLA